MKKTAVLALAFIVAAHALPATAQTAPSGVAQDLVAATEYSAGVHLAYILNPSDRINDESRQGLKQLSDTLMLRTAVEPTGVTGVDIERDAIAYFPFIYWPVTADSKTLSVAAQKKLQKYLDTGGVVLFDMRDAGGAVGSSRVLRRVLGDISLRPLVPMDKEHTLTKSFFLLSRLRGSFDYETVWVESPGAKGTETVSSVVIGENNWAGAWAGTTLPRDSREREMALRAGVNVVMFALMGNYKSDQVHVPSILERLERK